MHNTKHIYLLSFVTALSLLFPACKTAAQTFSIEWFTIDGGGGAASGIAPSGTSFSLFATIGQHDAGVVASGVSGSGSEFLLASGFLAETGIVQPPPCPADFNHDDFVNPDDLADFITCFFLDVQFPGFCAEADFNHDAFRDPDDLADFITTFFLTVQLGC